MEIVAFRDLRDGRREHGLGSRRAVAGQQGSGERSRLERGQSSLIGDDSQEYFVCLEIPRRLR